MSLQRPSRICDQQPKKRALPKDISRNLEFLQLDLSDQVNIKCFVEKIKTRNFNIDLLINNAGVMWVPKSYTKEGIELHFGVNYVGHFLLVLLLIPLMKEPSRILNVGSITSSFGKIPFEDLNLKQQYNRFEAYSNSKLAICHFTQSLAHRLENSGKKISVHYIDPGTSNTEITKSMPFILHLLFNTVGKWIFKSPFQGACCTIYAALAKELEGKTGLCLFEGKIQKESVRSGKIFDEEREKLWQISETLSSIKYPF